MDGILEEVLKEMGKDNPSLLGEDEESEDPETEEESEEEPEEEAVGADDDSEESAEEDTDEEEEQEEEEPEKEPDEGDEEFSSLPESKSDHAFKDMRNRISAFEAEQKKYDTLAKGFGFKDAKEMIAKLEAEQLSKEAKAKNVSPEVLAELKTAQNELEALKQKQAERETAEKLSLFVKELDTFAKANSLTDKEKRDLVDRMGEDGYTVEMLSNIKNPKVILNGYNIKKITKATEQATIRKIASKTALAEERVSSGERKIDETSLDKLAESLVRRVMKSR